jgi:outer membrane biosynthesis protein TonB
MQSASRTLVMSPPELWEVIDQPDRMQGLMCALIGRATDVTVNERQPESVLRWEATEEGADAWIEVQLAEKGWGTNVKLKAENGDEPTKLEGWLDAVLDELATPQKRPFEGRDAPPPPPEPVEETTPEPELTPVPDPEPVPQAVPAPEPLPEPDPVAPAATENPEPEQPRRLRRFFGL